MRIDVYDATVDLAKSGVGANRLDREVERLVIEHAARDEDHILRTEPYRAIVREVAVEERRAPRPKTPTLREDVVHLSNARGWKSAWVRRRRTRREGESGHVVEAKVGDDGARLQALNREPQHLTVLALTDDGWLVQMDQAFGTVVVCHGHRQIAAWGRRQHRAS